VQTQFKNYIQNSYFKLPEARELKMPEVKVRSGKSHFLEENDDAVKALASHVVVKNGNGGGRHKKAGTKLWNSLGEDGQAQWKRVAALSAK
jgi:hypothetical protein